MHSRHEREDDPILGEALPAVVAAQAIQESRPSLRRRPDRSRPRVPCRAHRGECTRFDGAPASRSGRCLTRAPASDWGVACASCVWSPAFSRSRASSGAPSRRIRSRRAPGTSSGGATTFRRWGPSSRLVSSSIAPRCRRPAAIGSAISRAMPRAFPRTAPRISRGSAAPYRTPRGFAWAASSRIGTRSQPRVARRSTTSRSRRRSDAGQRARARVRAAFRADAERWRAVRRRAEDFACRDIALVVAARFGSCFSARVTARERRREVRRSCRPRSSARRAPARVRADARPFGGTGNATPARRAFERPIAIACFVERAPCFPSRTWWISSRTNSPACVVGDLPSRRSLAARARVSLSGIMPRRRAILVPRARPRAGGAVRPGAS